MAWNDLPVESERRDWLEDKTPYVIQKKEDDPVAIRISVGGQLNKEIGIYVVYRGDIQDTLEVLEKAVAAIKKEFNP